MLLPNANEQVFDVVPNEHVLHDLMMMSFQESFKF